MLARRAGVFFVLSIMSLAFLAYRAYEFNAPCRHWRAAHQSERASAPVREPDGSWAARFSPSDLLPGTTASDQVAVVAFLGSIVGFFTYLPNYLWVRFKLRGRASSGC